jgi:hypothetical protein
MAAGVGSLLSVLPAVIEKPSIFGVKDLEAGELLHSAPAPRGVLPSYENRARSAARSTFPVTSIGRSASLMTSKWRGTL